MTEEDPGTELDVVDARPRDAVAPSSTDNDRFPDRACQRHDGRASGTVYTADMRARVLDIIAGIIEIHPESIRPDRLLVEYGLDSARVMDLIVALEDELGVAISDDVARGLRRVDDIVRFICAQVNPSSLARP